MSKTKAKIRDGSLRQAECCWNCDHSGYTHYNRWSCFVGSKTGTSAVYDEWCECYEKAKP